MARSEAESCLKKKKDPTGCVQSGLEGELKPMLDQSYNNSCGMSTDYIREAVSKRVKEEEGFSQDKDDSLNCPPPDEPEATTGPGPDEPIKDGRYISNFSSEFVLKCLSRNQVGDSELFKEIHRGKLLYIYSEKKWYRWVGHYWDADKLDTNIAGVQAVCHVYELQLQRISWESSKARLRNEPHDKTSDVLEKAIKNRLVALQAWPRILNVLELAKVGDTGLSISGDSIDSNPLLIAFLNGVLELDTGIFRHGKPSDMIITHCEVEWLGENTTCQTFDRFVSEIVDRDVDMVLFLQRFFGYCLSGMMVERVLPIFWGENGQNGKGTLIETLYKILGKLAGEIPSETLLANNRDSSGASARPDLMQLRGKRLVWCSESNKAKTLDVAKSKWLSGGDTIVCRPLYGQLVSFTPTAKIVFITNHRPRADGTDSALWHRILLIPFTLSFIENPQLPHERKRDKHLQEKLIAESSGIVAWLYRGFKSWRENGLMPPDKILSATKDFRNDNDSLSEFISACCIVAPGTRVKPTEIFASYQRFCIDEGLEADTNTNFFNAMKSKFARERNSRGRFYIGITLKNE